MASKAVQWVNLERKAVYVAGDIKSQERLKYLRVKVKFSNAKAANFKVRIVPKGGNAVYTPAEQNRNQLNFVERHTRSQLNLAKQEVELDEKIYLVAAGGNEYEIEAKYKNKTVKKTPRTVSTKRKVFFQPVEMVGSTKTPFGSTISAYDKLFVVLEEKGGTGSIPYFKNVDSDVPTQRFGLISSTKTAYTIANYEPAAFAVAFVQSLASRAEKELVTPAFSLTRRLASGGGSSTTMTWTLPNDTYLWFGMNDADDLKNGGKGDWLVTNGCTFVDDKGKKTIIPDANVTIDLTRTRTAQGGYNVLIIDIPASAKNLFSKRTGTLVFKLRVVDGFSGGYSEPEINFITVATSCWWVDVPDPERIQVLNHEMGHKLGMVPEGLSSELDAPGTLYGGTLNQTANQKGHQGPHCEKGVNYVAGRANEWEGTPGCVMFGATSCYDPTSGGHVGAPATYCADCEKLVRKLDLDGSSLPGFKNSITLY